MFVGQGDQHSLLGGAIDVPINPLEPGEEQTVTVMQQAPNFVSKHVAVWIMGVSRFGVALHVCPEKFIMFIVDCRADLTPMYQLLSTRHNLAPQNEFVGGYRRIPPRLAILSSRKGRLRFWRHTREQTKHLVMVPPRMK